MSRRLKSGVAACFALMGGLFVIASSAQAAAPANDNFADAESLGNGLTASASGTNVDATKELGEPNHAGGAGGHSVWYQWTAPTSGEFRLDTCGSSGNFNTLLGVYTGSNVALLTTVASNDQSQGPNCDFTYKSEVKFSASAGTTYRIAVDGFVGDTGDIGLHLAAALPPANDDFANTASLGNGTTASVTGTNVDATKEAGEPDHADDPGGASVWYSWTAPSSGQFRVGTCNSEFDTLLAVYTGSPVSGLTEVASNDESPGPNCNGQSQSELTLFATSATTYRIAVDGYSEGATLPPWEGPFVLELNLITPPVNDLFAEPPF
jgi:hypothetical protein